MVNTEGLRGRGMDEVGGDDVVVARSQGLVVSFRWTEALEPSEHPAKAVLRYYGRVAGLPYILAHLRGRLPYNGVYYGILRYIKVPLAYLGARLP